MTDQTTALGKPPVRLIAELDGVYVFQTQALAGSDDLAHQNPQSLLKSGQASYGELNLGLHVNDDSKQVLSNRMRLLSAISEQLSAIESDKQALNKQHSMIHSLHWVNQVHGKQVHDIDNRADDNKNLSMQPLDADAMVSQQAQIGLAIMTADCVPIVLYQPASKRIAAIHAGWQGLSCGVIKATTERFAHNEPIFAWIGCCISQHNYEVGRQVLNQLWTGCQNHQLLDLASLADFEQLFSMASNTDNYSDTDTSSIDNKHNMQSAAQIHNNDLQKSMDKTSNYATLSTNNIYSDKVKLNLPKLAVEQLQSLGVQVANAAAIACSYEDTRYYSYRRQTHLQQPATGRMALIIVRSR